MEYDFSIIVDEFPSLIRGVWVTLVVCASAIMLSLVVAVFLTIARQSRFRLLRAYVHLHVSFARGTPLFVQMLLVYYFIPNLGFDVPPLLAGIVALSLNSAAYGSEIMRGALTAVSNGQIEAARALGFPRWRIWQRVTLPQVFILMVPPISFEFAGLTRASAILSVIGVTELTRVGVGIVATTLRPMEVWIVIGAVYFLLIYGIGYVSRLLEDATRPLRPN